MQLLQVNKIVHAVDFAFTIEYNVGHRWLDIDGCIDTDIDGCYLGEEEG